MTEILFFGTCAGTEPIPDMQHTSFALKINDVYYWFDAGENCSRTAHLMDVDLLKVKSVFISHPHMDHIGGLGNLLWNIRKLSYVRDSNPIEDKVHLFTPDNEISDSIMNILKRSEKGFACNFEIITHRINDGLIYKDENITVYAFHNHHLSAEEPDDGWHSFSFRIESSEKNIVFSGDVRDFDDLDSCLGESCDCLLMETGHHKISDVCSYADAHNVKKLIFVHNGRHIINDRVGALKETSACCCEVIISSDKQIVTI